MKKFKEYEKEYEDLINVERSLKMVPLEKVSNTLGLTNFQYTQMFQKF